MSKISSPLISPATASSGIFPSGVVIAAPNGSGWLVGVNNAGTLTTTGPIELA